MISTVKTKYQQDGTNIIYTDALESLQMKTDFKNYPLARSILREVKAKERKNRICNEMRLWI